MLDIGVVGVVGAGTMGSGIAQSFAQAGFNVTLVDASVAALERARATVDNSLARFVAKGKLTGKEREATLSRIVTARQIDSLSHVDFVVEAINEQVEPKQALFKRLDEIARPGVVLASNTSSIPISALALATRRPASVLGMHFMNPVPMMVLVELVRGKDTSSQAMHLAARLCERIGKTPVEAADRPGFIANRILLPMINEAVYAAAEGVGTPEAIDTVMTLGMNHPMGPLRLADLIGLDVCEAILKVLHEGFGDPKYRPCPLLTKMVEAGQLGRKSGHGFYQYRSAVLTP